MSPLNTNLLINLIRMSWPVCILQYPFCSPHLLFAVGTVDAVVVGGLAVGGGLDGLRLGGRLRLHPAPGPAPGRGAAAAARTLGHRCESLTTGSPIIYYPRM